MIGDFIALFRNEPFVTVARGAWEFMPTWLPLLVIIVWWELFRNYKQRAFIRKEGSVLLEITLPKEVTKSPAAMENVLATLHEPVAGGHVFSILFEGEVRPWYSLEIVSLGGEVHFYIWGRKSYKHAIETQLYAQFPGIVIQEAPDYSLPITHDPKKYTFQWFGQLKLVNDEAFPIKTYIDYGLDRDPKDEHKIDPLVPLLEFMGSLNKGEYIWMQILIQPHSQSGEKFSDYGRLFKKKNWKDIAEEKMKEYIKKNAPSVEAADRVPTVRDLTDDQREAVKSMERNMSKWAYDTMIRLTYFAEKDKVRGANVGGMIRSFKPTASQGLNGLKPGKYNKFKYPQFQDFRNFRRYRNERKLLEAYKRRSIFNPPFKNFMGKPYVLTVEELATLFHFPSELVATTPTLNRTPSKRAEAPSNLPI